MELLIESLDTEVSNSFKKEIEKKFQNAARIYKRVLSCNVTLFKENYSNQNNHCIEAKMVVPGNVLFAKERAESFQSALDQLITNIKHQLLKYKEQLEEVR
jgi:putative sigma-54 modulation protein